MKMASTLAESQTFYGNVGEQTSRVAYRYIEKIFIPQALALTKTLSENEADNVFYLYLRTG
ncbi:MAG: hypothetical protein ACLUD0_06470 [Eubacterium ramulus]